LALAIANVGATFSPAAAGEISGLPPHSPPTVRPDYYLFLGNDFLVTGTDDDFRTQQFSATARFKDRWVAVLDQSIFTNDEALLAPAARIDTMTLSLGYDVIQDITASRKSIVTAGLGVRATGNFAGSRIQNGIHRLIESDTSDLSYTTTRQTDVSIWGLAEHYGMLRSAKNTGRLDTWDLGYSVRAGAFVTADGQIDAVAGAYGVASRTNFDIWLGLRHDWRSGYAFDSVLHAAANQEEALAVAWGVQMGSLVLESVHRMDSTASYGQLSFISAPETRKETLSGDDKVDVQLGLHMPDVLFQIAGRLHYKLLVPESSVWRESYLIDIRAGQPQYGNDVSRFVETFQATVGVEWSRAVTDNYDWLRFYGNVSGGWRSEQLLGRATLLGEESTAIDRGVLVVGMGLEIDATRFGTHWRHSLRFGVTGWKPSSAADVSVGGAPSTIQEPGVSLVLAWTIDYH
jgi:hypothetical protein